MDRGSSVVIVTFTYFNDQAHVGGFGESLFAKQGISCLHFISKWNHWWQTSEMEEALKIISESKFLNDKHTIGYGSSMGGYGAIRFSPELRLNQVLAISPQYSIDPAKVPFEDRWNAYLPKISFIYDNMNVHNKTETYILYDPFDGDKRHAELYVTLPYVSLVAIPFGGHPVSHFLNEIGLLQPIILSLANGSAKPSDWKGKIRKIRSNSGNYWVNFTRYLLEKDKIGVGKDVALAGLKIFPSDFRLWRNLCYFYEKIGDIHGAREAVNKAFSIVPDNPAIQRLAERFSK